MKWHLWVDYQRTDGRRLTHTSVRNAAPGVAPTQGDFLIVGNEDADLAVAEVVEVKESGVILVRVLPGSVEENLHLVTARRPA